MLHTHSPLLLIQHIITDDYTVTIEFRLFYFEKKFHEIFLCCALSQNKKKSKMMMTERKKVIRSLPTLAPIERRRSLYYISLSLSLSSILFFLRR